MGNYDIILIGGAPGSGKSSVCKIIKAKLGNTWLDCGWLREFHLNYGWKNKGRKEEQMAFENTVFIIKNYLKHGYRNIMVDDLQYDKFMELRKIFPKRRILLVILTCKDSELKRRLLAPRESGFDNVKMALKYNEQWKDCNLKGQLKIDNSKHNNPQTAASIILNEIKAVCNSNPPSS